MWLFWFLANTLGFAAGIAVSLAALELTGEIASIIAFGALAGVAQWLVLRKHLAHTGWWILVSALAAPIGLITVNTVHRAALWGGSSILLGFAAFGLVLGIAQWFVLRAHFRKAGFWVLASTIGWPLGGLAAGLLDLRLSDHLKVIVDFSLVGMLSGVVSGPALILLIKNPATPQAGKASPLRGLGLVVLALIVIVLSSFWIPAPVDQIDLTTMPELGITPSCPQLPPLECTGSPAYCTELVPFEPVEGSGYFNSPLNGETWDDQYRSYLRRDLAMIIQRASARVACETKNWDYREMEPLGLGDMSEANGAIPGTSTGRPSHPPLTHTDGNDIDIAYFQSDIPDLLPSQKSGESGVEGNRLRPVCKHTVFGAAVNHCTQAPRLLDPWRTGLMMAHISEHPQIRVIGVDGQVGLILETALDQLAQAGWIDPGLRPQINLVYEETNEGKGWFRHHHHHLHISMHGRMGQN